MKNLRLFRTYKGLSLIVFRASNLIGLDLQYFLKNGAWIFFRYSFVAIVGFIVSVAFTRLTSKDVLGQYQLIIAFITFFSIFTLPGLNTVSLKEVIKGNPTAILKATHYSFIGSLLLTAACFVYGTYNLTINNQSLGWSLIVSGILAPFFYAPNNWYVAYEGKLDFRSPTTRIIISQIILSVALICSLWLKVNIIILVFIYYFTQAILTTYFYFEATSHIKNTITNALDLRSGILISLQKFIIGFSDSLQVFIISYLYGFEKLAIFQISFLFVGASTGFVGALTSLYFPLLMKYKTINFWRNVTQNILIGICISILYLIFLQFFFLRLYGTGYAEGFVLAKGFSVLIILLPLRLFLINIFTTKNNNQIIIACLIFSNIMALVVFFVTQKFGFFWCVTSYLYALNFFFIIPLLVYYTLQKRFEETSKNFTKSY